MPVPSKPSKPPSLPPSQPPSARRLKASPRGDGGGHPLADGSAPPGFVEWRDVVRADGGGADGDPAAAPRSGTLGGEGRRSRVKGEAGAGGPAAAAKAKELTLATDWEKAKLVEAMGDASGGMVW